MKRFTETTKWNDPWFMDLPVKYKAFWMYICDQCDNAGVWEPNIRLAVAQIGEPLELVEILRVFAGRVEQLKDGKLWITKFIEFQYGILSPDCKPHVPILKRLGSLSLINRVSKGYGKTIHSLKEKEKEKDKKEGESEGKQVLMIYSLYPRKVERPDALRAIKKALTKVSFEFLSERVALYAKSRDGQNPGFTPYPATWFNKERFNDDPETWKDAESNGSNGRVVRSMSAFEIEKRVKAISEEINATFKRNGGRVEGDGIDELKRRRDDLQKQLLA